MEQGLRNYLIITGGYWGFTITDGAIRMLVVLHFHQLGYSPFEIAMLFLFYEFFGVVTNLVGGWLGARIGLNRTMHTGMVLQILALLMLAVPVSWLSVGYVMLAQALSGIAKDLNKMSAKASVKLMLPPEGGESKLFRWVAVLTGSKNALKGAGFFIGALLLAWIGFREAVSLLAAMLLATLVVTWWMLPKEIGRMAEKPKFSHVFSNSAAVNWLSAARFFLFGARDVWFVVALPVFLSTVLGWNHMQVGTFFALWVIGYGFVQGIAPDILRSRNRSPDGATARLWSLLLTLVPAVMVAAMAAGADASQVVLGGLALFALLFAVNSSLHSYLILSWSQHERVSMNVGFYYMANAAGRLAGTLLSGVSYQYWGLEGSLVLSASALFIAFLLSFKLPMCSRGKR